MYLPVEINWRIRGQILSEEMFVNIRMELCQRATAVVDYVLYDNGMEKKCKIRHAANILVYMISL